MKIYTRRGDGGETGLLGGDRVPKTDPRVEAYGTLDELNAAVGMARALAREAGGELVDDARLKRVQDDLFALGSRLAAADPGRAREKGLVPDFPPGRVEDLESWIDELDEELPELDAFVLPGGAPTGAQLHTARTVCRRAERAVVRLAGEHGELREEVLPYVNRLSDLLFTLARAANRRAGAPETEWEPVRRRPGAGEGGEGNDGGADGADGPPAGDRGGERAPGTGPAGEAQP